MRRAKGFPSGKIWSNLLLFFMMIGGVVIAVQLPVAAVAEPAKASADSVRPVRLIFDTDMGNDIDDALALCMIHSLQSRDECELLAVTSSKDNEFSAAFIDAVNTFYGRGNIPIGAVRGGKTPADGNYVRQVAQAKNNGSQKYPHDLLSGKDAPEAVGLLRKTLATQPNRSVVFVVVGFSTNIARLLESKPDEYSPLTGKELVAQKCKLLSIMAGMFSKEGRHKEYNVYKDLPAAKKVFADWPTVIVASGYEVGKAIKYPAVSIEQDFNYIKHHPVRDAYRLYLDMPYDRESWDLTSVLYAVRPGRGYFGLFEPGTIVVDNKDITQFRNLAGGRHRYLTVTAEQIIRVKEALVQLTSQPPANQNSNLGFFEKDF
jgi:inosine-uridine nucleoside N-ribohydrolase